MTRTILCFVLTIQLGSAPQASQLLTPTTISTSST